MSVSRSRFYRAARLEWLLSVGDVLKIGTLPNGGVRLIHYEWPRSHYVDYWPETSKVRTADDREFKGWAKLLKVLEIKRCWSQEIAQDIHRHAKGER